MISKTGQVDYTPMQTPCLANVVTQTMTRLELINSIKKVALIRAATTHLK